MQLSNGLNIEQVGSAMILRFTRPEVRNPLSVDVLEVLTDIVGKIERDVRRLIFSGSESVFASGADLREIAEVTGSNAEEFAIRGQRLMNMIASIDAKTVAAVNGFCYGGALDLTLACDMRIAATSAEFCHPGGGLGIMTGWGGTQRLPRLVGELAALDLFLTGKKVSAAEALRIGLIDLIADDPLAAAMDSCL